MKLRLLPSAKSLDDTANKWMDHRGGTAAAHLLLAPLRRLHDDPCTCGEADCPERDNA